MVYIYILELQNKRYYTGITKDIVKRIMEHNKGKSKSTKKYRPVTLIHLETSDNYIHARQQEKYIKNIGAKHYLTKQKINTTYKMIH